jgi:hypothetical protein
VVARTVPVSVAGRRVAGNLPDLAARLIGRQALDDPVAGEHAPIDREVPADHKSTHGCVLLGQRAGFVCEISLVLAPIDQNQTCVAIGIPVALIRGVMPSTAPAKACKTSRLACQPSVAIGHPLSAGT